MIGWLEQVENEIRERKLFRDGDSILVAVSGGLDSMVLLHVLHSLAPNHGWKIAVAHFNHQLRGVHADKDQQLVSETASRLHLPFFTDSADVKWHAAQSGLSIEMAARKLRHDFLASTAKKSNCSAVALAHHAGDQVELFFLRILRGTGTQGLAGMKWIAPSPSDPSTRLVRPLLDKSKTELADYARAENIAFSEDASNGLIDIPRNRIRHELIPLLEREYQPALTKTTLRLMELAGAEADFITDTVDQLPENVCFNELPVALQRRSLQNQLFELKMPVDFDLVEQLRLNPDSAVSVSGGHSLVRDSEGKIQIQGAETIQFSQTSRELVLKCAAGEKIDFDGLKIAWSVSLQGNQAMDRQLNREYFDADKVGKTILLRHWQPGDRFHPIGAETDSKLQDLFTNLKVNRAERHKRVVAVSQSGLIFWVEGLRISERFKLDKQTVRWLNWEWCR